MKITLSAKYWASIRLVPKANLAVLAASAILNFKFLRHTLDHIHEQKVKMPWFQFPTERTRVAKDKMAKSIRSKRKRKLRAERRQKLKPKVKAKLEEVLGINDKKMIVETEESGGGTVEETQEEIPQASQETSNNEEGTGKDSIFYHENSCSQKGVFVLIPEN